jgi:hypothetical protein
VGHMPSTADLLPAEAQVLLAERRAAWTRQKPSEFEQRLADAADTIPVVHRGDQRSRLQVPT